MDLVTLQDRLKEKDVPPEVSSLDFVRDIVTMVPTSANVRSYAQIVHEKEVRKLIRTTEEIANTCYAGKDPLEDILADTEKQIFNLLQSRSTQDFVPIKQVAINVLEKIEGGVQDPGHGYRRSNRVYRPGLQAVRLPALGPGTDSRPPFHGKDGLCFERGGPCGGAQEAALYGVQSGDVQGAAGQPYALHGVQRGRPEASGPAP